MKRKGIVYTLYVIAFIISLLLFVLLQDGSRQGNLIGEKIRSDEVGYFVNGVQEDFGRSVMISCRKAVLSLVNNETDAGTFDQNANESIAELLQNGTLDGIGVQIMTNSTVSAWAATLETIGNRMGVELKITMNHLNVLPSSAFYLAVTGNTTYIAYDPLTNVKYNRTLLTQELIPVEGLEDPYITIRSFGARRNTINICDSTAGTAPGTQWTYGIAYISTGTDCTGVSSKATKIFITDTINSKPTCSGFNATITMDDSASGANYLRDAAGAYSAAKNDTYVVLSNNALWITNSTSCYFEAPDGPSFLDRLEGRQENSAKYDVSGAIEGIGSFLYVPPAYLLDYKIDW